MAYSDHLHSLLKIDMGKAGSGILTGMIVSLLMIIMSISYPSLIFSGGLEEHSGIGIQMALLSAGIFCLLLSLLSTCPGVVGIAQGETAAVIGLAAASIAEAGMASGRTGQVLPTVIATIIISALLIGLFFTLLGFLRLGNMIRFVPLPVMGGFLAGVGWLLSSGAVRSMTGLPFAFRNWTAFLVPYMLLKWLPGLVSALVLLLLQHYRRSVFNLFIVVIATVSLFWLTAWLIGVPQARLGADGWLMAWGNRQSNWVPFEYAGLFTSVDWGAVLSQLPHLGSLLVIASISVLMAASSLELISGRDINFNRELIVAGLGNFVCAGIGSLPGYHSLGASTLAQKMGAPLRMVGLVGALMCGLTYLLGTSFLSMLPKMLVGTIIFYIGISLLVEWLYDTWFKLPRADYAVLLLVFGCVSFVGLIQGVVIGFIAGVTLFTFEYGRTGIARQEGASVSLRSRVVYPESMGAVLREFGRESYIAILEGFIFFGTANSLLNRIRSRMRDTGSMPLRCVVLDFKRVSGVDSSAALSFQKLRRYAETSNFTIAVSGLAPEIDNSLRLAGAYEGLLPSIGRFDDLDHALEYCESIILSAHMPRAGEHFNPIAEQLQRAFPDSAKAAEFMKHLNPVSLPKGEHLISRGDGSDDLFFIERGRVAMIIETADGAPMRVATMGPGTVVGEIAFFLGPPRSVTVTVESDLKAWRLSKASWADIRKHDQELAIAFNDFMLRTLSERLLEINRLNQIE